MQCIDRLRDGPSSLCIKSKRRTHARGGVMFDKDRFIENCLAAVKGDRPYDAIRELVERAVSEPSQVVRALGEPVRSGVETLYRGDDLTILNLSWGPRMF